MTDRAIRETGAALPLEVTATGWRTPEFWVDLRRTDLIKAQILEGLETVIAERCGVPVKNVVGRCRQSWVDPRGRLCVTFEVSKSPGGLRAQPVPPATAAPADTLSPARLPGPTPDGDSSSRPTP